MCFDLFFGAYVLLEAPLTSVGLAKSFVHSTIIFSCSCVFVAFFSISGDWISGFLVSVSAIHIIVMHKPLNVGLRTNTTCERMAFRFFWAKGEQLEVSDLLPTTGFTNLWLPSFHCAVAF